MIITANNAVSLFVNGHYIERFTPTQYDRVDFSRTGAAGVYLNTSAMTGDFTNFTVAPAPSTEFWDAMQPLNPWHS